MEDVLATVPVLRRRFTVDEVERMAEAGIFGPEERVELPSAQRIERNGTIVPTALPDVAVVVSETLPPA